MSGAVKYALDDEAFIEAMRRAESFSAEHSWGYGSRSFASHRERAVELLGGTIPGGHLLDHAKSVELEGLTVKVESQAIGDGEAQWCIQAAFEAVFADERQPETYSVFFSSERPERIRADLEKSAIDQASKIPEPTGANQPGRL